METSHTHPPEPTTPAPPADPLKALQDKLKALQEQTRTSQQQIASAEQQAQQTALGLESARLRKKEADARESALGHLLTEIQNSKLATDAQRQAGIKDSQAALDAHQDITRELGEQLSEEHRKELDQVVKSVDEEIASLKEQMKSLEEEAPALQAKVEAAKKAIPEKEAGLKAAQDAHKGLAKAVQEARGQVNKNAAALGESFQKGLINPAYLQAGELKKALDRLAGLTDAAYETSLIAQIYLAWGELADAKTAHEEAAKAWKDHQTALSVAEAALSKAEAARWEKIMAGVQHLMETEQA
jgi:uncharacterized protein YoxC